MSAPSPHPFPGLRSPVDSPKLVAVLCTPPAPAPADDRLAGVASPASPVASFSDLVSRTPLGVPPSPDLGSGHPSSSLWPSQPSDRRPGAMADGPGDVRRGPLAGGTPVPANGPPGAGSQRDASPEAGWDAGSGSDSDPDPDPNFDSDPGTSVTPGPGPRAQLQQQQQQQQQYQLRGHDRQARKLPTVEATATTTGAGAGAAILALDAGPQSTFGPAAGRGKCQGRAAPPAPRGGPAGAGPASMRSWEPSPPPPPLPPLLGQIAPPRRMSPQPAPPPPPGNPGEASPGHRPTVRFVMRDPTEADWPTDTGHPVGNTAGASRPDRPGSLPPATDRPAARPEDNAAQQATAPAAAAAAAAATPFPAGTPAGAAARLAAGGLAGRPAGTFPQHALPGCKYLPDYFQPAAAPAPVAWPSRRAARSRLHTHPPADADPDPHAELLSPEQLALEPPPSRTGRLFRFLALTAATACVDKFGDKARTRLAIRTHALQAQLSGDSAAATEQAAFSCAAFHGTYTSSGDSATPTHGPLLVDPWSQRPILPARLLRSLPVTPHGAVPAAPAAPLGQTPTAPPVVFFPPPDQHAAAQAPGYSLAATAAAPSSDWLTPHLRPQRATEPTLWIPHSEFTGSNIRGSSWNSPLPLDSGFCLDSATTPQAPRATLPPVFAPDFAFASGQASLSAFTSASTDMWRRALGVISGSSSNLQPAGAGPGSGTATAGGSAVTGGVPPRDDAAAAASLAASDSPGTLIDLFPTYACIVKDDWPATAAAARISPSAVGTSAAASASGFDPRIRRGLRLAGLRVSRTYIVPAGQVLIVSLDINPVLAPAVDLGQCQKCGACSQPVLRTPHGQGAESDASTEAAANSLADDIATTVISEPGIESRSPDSLLLEPSCSLSSLGSAGLSRVGSPIDPASPGLSGMATTGGPSSRAASPAERGFSVASSSSSLNVHAAGAPGSPGPGSSPPMTTAQANFNLHLRRTFRWEATLEEKDLVVEVRFDPLDDAPEDQATLEAASGSEYPQAPRTVLPAPASVLSHSPLLSPGSPPRVGTGSAPPSPVPSRLSGSFSGSAPSLLGGNPAIGHGQPAAATVTPAAAAATAAGSTPGSGSPPLLPARPGTRPAPPLGRVSTVQSSASGALFFESKASPVSSRAIARVLAEEDLQPTASSESTAVLVEQAGPPELLLGHDVYHGVGSNERLAASDVVAAWEASGGDEAQAEHYFAQLSNQHFDQDPSSPGAEAPGPQTTPGDHAPMLRQQSHPQPSHHHAHSAAGSPAGKMPPGRRASDPRPPGSSPDGMLPGGASPSLAGRMASLGSSTSSLHTQVVPGPGAVPAAGSTPAAAAAAAAAANNASSAVWLQLVPPTLVFASDGPAGGAFCLNASARGRLTIRLDNSYSMVNAKVVAAGLREVLEWAGSGVCGVCSASIDQGFGGSVYTVRDYTAPGTTGPSGSSSSSSSSSSEEHTSPLGPWHPEGVSAGPVLVPRLAVPSVAAALGIALPADAATFAVGEPGSLQLPHVLVPSPTGWYQLAVPPSASAYAASINMTVHGWLYSPRKRGGFRRAVALGVLKRVIGAPSDASVEGNGHFFARVALPLPPWRMVSNCLPPALQSGAQPFIPVAGLRITTRLVSGPPGIKDQMQVVSDAFIPLIDAAHAAPKLAAQPHMPLTDRCLSGLIDGLAVISDLDDTIRLTQVLLGRRRVVANTFFRESLPVDGMANLYHDLARGRTASTSATSLAGPPALSVSASQALARDRRLLEQRMAQLFDPLGVTWLIFSDGNDLRQHPAVAAYLPRGDDCSGPAERPNTSDPSPPSSLPS
ncbi:hypothetical protein H696_02890 [Fonticula alba]|uniref:Phosphatidate phosphatase APP1 catalytic domain-containing protein n=1 Tax=Fonticula alba TaxID=691883 RepID=A0A058Z8D0_FONAL|nr:hypothetical protein H696_02890 [Fonticula alba]KCV70544.1 hypothetical protein H696_02890 [Fonticula alba]|eukprot:XP_009495060.1 hypothetical protein H696_02890 [Fonticula alba]